METVSQIKNRIRAFVATMPQDDDPLIEARAEAAHEKILDTSGRKDAG